MPLPFNFTEREDQNYYHDIRVYVMGTDVTPWLTGDVNITYTSNGGINTATFNLSNQRDAFVLTEENLTGNGKFRNIDPYSISGEYSESAKFAIWSLKNSKNKDGTPRNLKHSVKTFGPIQGSNDIKGAVKSTSRDSNEAQSTVTYTYPFSPGSLVFHKFDHVRIFGRNPLSMGDEWMVLFTGFLDVKPFTQDTVTGLSTIRMVAQDIRYSMQRMRTQVNPTASVANANAARFAGPTGVVTDSPNAGYFNDLVSQNFKINHVLATLTFRDTINFLILGESAPVRGEMKAFTVEGSSPNLNRIGEYTRGMELSYDPSGEKAKQDLEKWNNLVFFGQYTSSPTFMSFIDMAKMGSETHPWSETHSVWKGKVHYLFPSSGSPTSNLVESSYKEGQVGTDKIQWASRLELLLDVVEKLDYVMYVSPLGDIIFEFPMWDFSPADFGPSYERVYKFRSHVISRDINDEGGEAVSGIIVTSNFLQEERRGEGLSAGESQISTSQERIATIYSNTLASRIGVQVKSIYKPGIIDQAKLEQYGMIEFAKATAEFNKFSFKGQYRPFISVNRPIYDIDAYRIGCTNTVGTTWRLRDTVDIDIDLNYVRRGEIDTAGNITFRFITGGERNPLSYNTIYDRALLGSGISPGRKKDDDGGEST